MKPGLNFKDRRERRINILCAVLLGVITFLILLCAVTPVN